MDGPTETAASDTLMQSELLKLRGVVKQDDAGELRRALRGLPDSLQKSICLAVLDGSNLLEFAILNSCWNAAHLLASFISDADLKRIESKNYNADDLTWAKAIHVILKKYLKTREIRSLNNEAYQKDLKERMKAYWIAFKNGCVNLFSSIPYPRTFILFHKLGADIRQKALFGSTVVQRIIDSNLMNSNMKIQLLEYIKRVDKQLINEPSGFYNTPPVFRCYKFNYVKILRALDLPFEEVLKLKSAASEPSAQTLVDVLTIDGLGKYLTSEQRLQFFVHENNLDAMFTKAWRQSSLFIFPEIVQAFDLIAAQGRHPLPKYEKFLNIAQLRIYLHKLVKETPLKELERFYRKSGNVGSKASAIERNIAIDSKNFIGVFSVERLPSDMLTLLAAQLTLQDTIALFSVSKTMRDQYNNVESSLLWKIVAKNTFNKVKFSMYEQTGAKNDRNWKNILIGDSRIVSNWRNGKFTERVISTCNSPKFTLSEHWGTWTVPGSLEFWNCTTDELKKATFSPPAGYFGSECCFIESSPTRDPMIAVTHNGGNSGVSVCVASPTQILGTIKVPPKVWPYRLSKLDSNHIVFADNLNVIDVNQGTIVTSLPNREAASFTTNTFSTTPVIAMLSQDQNIKILDCDLKVVQNIPLSVSLAQTILPLDEYEYVIGLINGFMVIDTRFTSTPAIHSRRFPPVSSSINGASSAITVDPINKHLLQHMKSYEFSILWDLKTMTYSSVARDLRATSTSLINSRYNVILDTQYNVRAYDYN